MHEVEHRRGAAWSQSGRLEVELDDERAIVGGATDVWICSDCEFTGDPFANRRVEPSAVGKRFGIERNRSVLFSFFPII